MKFCNTCKLQKKYLRKGICKGCFYKLNPEQYLQHKLKVKEYSKTFNGKFLNAKSQAKDRNITWNLTKEDYIAIISNECIYCFGNLPLKGVGLDRKDNNKGYIKTNVVPCCTACNSIKGQYLSYDEMILVMKTVLEFRNVKTSCL